MEITAIIPVYNAASTIQTALESLFSQTSCHWRAICIDDGSSDNSQEVIKSFMAKGNRISLIEQENSGPSVARARAISLAETEYVAILDADDYWACDYVEKMLDAADGTQADILVPDVMEYDEKGIRNIPSLFTRMSEKPGMIIEDGKKGFELSLDWHLHGWPVLKTSFAKKYYTISEVEYSKFNADEFMARLLYLKSSKTFLCDTFYYYRICNASLTRSVSLKRVDSVITMYKVTELAIKNGISLNIVGGLFQATLSTMVVMLRFSRKLICKERKVAYAIVKGNYLELRNMFSIRYLQSVSWGRRIKLIFLLSDFTMLKLYAQLR